MQIIQITDWNKHQHYSNRRPPWVKLEIDIIEEFDRKGYPKKFFHLPANAKLTFILLVCLRANFEEYIPFPSEEWLKNRIGLKNIELEPLVNAGYITIDSMPDSNSASKDDSNHAPLSLPPENREQRTETDNRLFDLFWLNYPKKVGKQAALKAWSKIKNKKQVIEKMKQLLPQQIESEQWKKEGGQYIPNPATYLNQGRWEDEI